MPFDRPHDTEELNPGPEVAARVAASVIVLRDRADGPEVLLVQRNPTARFMGGAWVFPGGAVDEGETVEQTARRELEEEASIALPPAAPLVPFSRWITPAEVKIRFDTWFFVVDSPNGAEPAVDGEECVDARWIRPQHALDELGAGRLQLVFPTIKHLEQLAGFPSVAATLETARSRDVVAVQPRIIVEGEGARVLLPGEPGFDDDQSPG
jgi:8-oxo-dGTP pyrophosphatase MutT (NUDIX family)